jgi:hypothetical protein
MGFDGRYKMMFISRSADPKLEPCWGCGKQPILKEREHPIFGLLKKYACPECVRDLFSWRNSREEAERLWNGASRRERRRQEKKTGKETVLLLGEVK